METKSLIQFVSKKHHRLDTTADGSREAVSGILVRNHTTQRFITTCSKRSVKFVVCCHGRAVQSRLSDTVHSLWLDASAAKVTETTELATGGNSLGSLDNGRVS
jgi:hypothetical protein